MRNSGDRHIRSPLPSFTSRNGNPTTDLIICQIIISNFNDNHHNPSPSELVAPPSWSNLREWIVLTLRPSARLSFAGWESRARYWCELLHWGHWTRDMSLWDGRIGFVLQCCWGYSAGMVQGLGVWMKNDGEGGWIIMESIVCHIGVRSTP